MTTKSQSTTTKLEGSEPTLKMCDYRNKECAAYGVTVGGKWICNNHICEQRQRCWLNSTARVSANGVPTVDVKAIAEEVTDRWFRNDLPERARAQSSTRVMLRILVEDVLAAASTVAPQQSDQRMFAPPAEDNLHIAICNAVQSDQFTASDILRQALIDYQPTKLTRTELIRVQQRNGSGEVTAIMVSRGPAPSAAIQDETENAARVAPLRTALDEIEVALISIADGVSPQEAVGKAFNIINHERSKLNAAASERCLSEGEA